MPSPSAQAGPNHFVINCSDRYEFNNPGDSSDVQEVSAEVAITVKWNFGRTEAADVIIADPVWTKAGPGPHPVFDDSGPIVRPKGTVEWTLVNRWSASVETNPEKKAYRNIYLIEVKLLRTFTAKDAQGNSGTPVKEVVWDIPQRDVGNWISVVAQVPALETGRPHFSTQAIISKVAMFEPRHVQPLTPAAFRRRVFVHAFIALAVMLTCLSLGMLGYHFVEGLEWLDAYVNAAMILSGMGPLDPIKTPEGKFFAGSYAIFSGVAFLTTVGFFLAPIVHRLLHKFHLNPNRAADAP